MNSQENLHTTNCIRTYTGKYINVFDPQPELICIEDIAHALSNMPRFGGHLPKPHSVGKHSLNCMDIAPQHDKLDALMHDATEAYLMDMPRPIKLNMPEYKIIEENLAAAIALKYGLSHPLPHQIKIIDNAQLRWEWDNLMIGKQSYPILRRFYNFFRYLFVRENRVVEKRFIREFHKLTQNKFREYKP